MQTTMKKKILSTLVISGVALLLGAPYLEAKSRHYDRENFSGRGVAPVSNPLYTKNVQAVILAILRDFCRALRGSTL